MLHRQLRLAIDIDSLDPQSLLDKLLDHRLHRPAMRAAGRDELDQYRPVFRSPYRLVGSGPSKPPRRNECD
jgi:hypothetical protein